MGRTLRIVDRGTVVRHAPGTSRQSCAFPYVCITDGGRWLCSFRAAATKGATTGQHTRLTFSDDRGQSWSEPREPFAPPRVAGREGLLRAAAMTCLGGERVLAALMWVDHSDPSAPFFNERTEGLLDTRIFLSSSADGGRTWSAPALVDTSPFDCPTPITGPILRLHDGRLACPFELNKHYEDPAPWRHKSVLMFSSDGGRTWPEHTVVSDHPTVFYWDQRPSVPADGRVLDLFWTFDREAAVYRNIHACVSDDGARTFSAIWDTGLPGQPAPAADLGDGRLVLVYVDRTAAPVLRARTSRDGGRTWPAQTDLVIRRLEGESQTVRKASMQDAWAEMGKFSLGLPQTHRLADGRVLVVYYAGEDTDRTNVEWVLLEG